MRPLFSTKTNKKEKLRDNLVFSAILDGLNIKFSAFSTFLHFLIIMIIYLIPPKTEVFNIEKLNNIPERYANVILNVDKTKKIKKKTVFQEKITEKNVKFDKNSKNYSTFKFESQNATQKLSARERKIKSIVHRAGILSSKLSGELDGKKSYGGLNDNEIMLSDNVDITSTANGTPGIRGGVSGSGGSGSGSLGIGGPQTNGFSNRTGRNSIAIKGPEKRKRSIIATVGPSKFSGSLNKQQIQRVVRKNISQIKYCYENELLRKPNLKGNITVLWVINPQGKVKSVKITGATLKNKNIFNCMIKKIKRWKFPEPKGGGYSKIIYPFNFRAN